MQPRKKIKVAPWWAVDVLVAGLIHHGEQVEEGVPGGMEGHGAFYFYEIPMAVDGFGFNNDERMRRNYGERIPPRDPGNASHAPSLHQYPLEMPQYPLDTGIWRGIRWRRAGIHWILESGAGRRFPRCKLPLRAGIHWRHAGIHWVPESGMVSIGDMRVSIGYQNLVRYPLEMRWYPLGIGIWCGIHWRNASIHQIPESGTGGRFLLIPSLLLPPNKLGAALRILTVS